MNSSTKLPRSSIPRSTISIGVNSFTSSTGQVTKALMKKIHGYRLLNSVMHKNWSRTSTLVTLTNWALSHLNPSSLLIPEWQFINKEKKTKQNYYDQISDQHSETYTNCLFLPHFLLLPAPPLVSPLTPSKSPYTPPSPTPTTLTPSPLPPLTIPPPTTRHNLRNPEQDSTPRKFPLPTPPNSWSPPLNPSASPLMIEVDTWGEVNPKETKAQLTTTAGALDMQGFD